MQKYSISFRTCIGSRTHPRYKDDAGHSGPIATIVIDRAAFSRGIAGAGGVAIDQPHRCTVYVSAALCDDRNECDARQVMSTVDFSLGPSQVSPSVRPCLGAAIATSVMHPQIAVPATAVRPAALPIPNSDIPRTLRAYPVKRGATSTTLDKLWQHEAGHF